GGGAQTSTGQDIFLLELTGGGTYRWLRHFGGTYDFVNCGLAIGTDSVDNVAVAGILKGTADFGTGAVNSVNGTMDTFLAKYTAGGAPLWVRTFGTAGMEQGTALAVDPTDDAVVLGGTFDSAIDLGTGTLRTAGSYDLFLGLYAP
ncbi:MAG TPA: hypothetical protein VGK30_13070, partial [Candidatus Binatia bacterium]